MSTVHHCDLCGSPAAAFRCERCYNQLFCASCNDVFHRHPKRTNHIRQAIGNAAGWSMDPTRPPLPPKGEVLSMPAPVPPPRRHRLQPQQTHQFRIPSPFQSRQNLLSRIEAVGNTSGFFQHSGPQHQHHQHADGLISVPENGEDDRPPTPPPLSTIPRHPHGIPYTKQQSVPFQSGIPGLGTGGGHRWKSSAVHMSCGNLATPGIHQKSETVFGSFALGPRSNFVPQQHLVQKPAVPTTRSRFPPSDRGVTENPGFQVSSRPNISSAGSLQGRMSSRESLLHDPWSIADSQTSRKLLHSNSKGPELGTWRSNGGGVDSSAGRITRSEPRGDNAGRIGASQTLPASANRLTEWGINAGLGKQLYRPQYQQPLRPGFSQYPLNSGSVMSLNTLPAPDPLQSRSPSRLLSQPKIHQAQSMANLTCPSCQSATIWGGEPGEIEDRALSVMGRPYPPDDGRKYSVDMEKARHEETAAENNADAKAMQLAHQNSAVNEQHIRSRTSQRKKSFPLASPRRAPSVDVISEWRPQPQLPGQGESLRRRLTKSGQRSRQKSRHYARSVPPRSSSDDSEDFYSIGRSEEEDFQDSASFKNMSQSGRSRASPQPPLSMQSIPMDKWQCKFCTFLNPASSRICGICSKTNVVSKSSHPAVRHGRFKKHIRRSNTDQLIHNKDLMETVSLPPPEKEQSRCSSSLSSELDETQADDPPPIPSVKKTSMKQPTQPSSMFQDPSPAKPSAVVSTSQAEAQNKPVDVTVPDDVTNLEKKVHQLVIHSPVVSLSNESSPQHADANPMADSDADGTGEIVSGNVTLRAVTDAEIQVAGIQENASSQKTQPAPVAPAVSVLPTTKQCFSKGTSPPPIEIGTQTMEEEIFYEAPSVLPPRNAISESSNLNKGNDAAGIPAIPTQIPRENAGASGAIKPMHSGFGPQQSQHVQLGFLPVDGSNGWHANTGEHKLFVHPYTSRTRSHSAVMPSHLTKDVRDPRQHYDIQFRGVSVETPPPPMHEQMPNRTPFPDPNQPFSNRRGLYKENVANQGMELLNIFRSQEAEQENFRAEDFEIAMLHCGSKHPIRWLKENWPGMVRTVQILTSDYQSEMDGPRNSIGRITVQEAEQALRLHKGNVWASVVECTQQRKDKLERFMKKYPNVEREEIVNLLERWSGDVERIELELAKAQFKPIFMHMMAPRGREHQEHGSHEETPSPYSLPFHAFPQTSSREHAPNAGQIAMMPNSTLRGSTVRSNPTVSEPAVPANLEFPLMATAEMRAPATAFSTVASEASNVNSNTFIKDASFNDPVEDPSDKAAVTTVGVGFAGAKRTQIGAKSHVGSLEASPLPETASADISATTPPGVPAENNENPALFAVASVEDRFHEPQLDTSVTAEPPAAEISDLADTGVQEPTNDPRQLAETTLEFPIEIRRISPKKDSPAPLPVPVPAPVTHESVPQSIGNKPALATTQTPDAYTLSTHLNEKPAKPDFERKVRRLLAEGLVRNYKEGEIAARLMELDFSESNCIHAARECDSLYTAITYLQQSCEICLLKVPISQMVSMLHCTHRCCRSCAKVHFTNCIKERSILEIKCPFCDQPNLQNDDVAQEYFSHLEIILKNTVDDDAFHLYVQKLRDWSLMKDPAFRWCAQCSSGFIRNPDRKKHECPECKAVFCADCDKPWTREHDDLSCQQYMMATEIKGGDQIHQAEMLIEEEHKENGIQCPHCHFRYLLARGGCMHFTCVQCRHEFCSGCDRPFHMGSQCPLKADFCAKLGLHAHHPRNCLFYLRDKEPAALKTLLREHGLEFKEHAEPAGMAEPGKKRKCFITEVRESPSGLEEHICGEEAPEGHAGLCRNHYVEYLGSLIRRNMLDPVSIMSTDDLEVVVRRANLRMPFRGPGETPEEYRPKLLKLIEEMVPLDAENPNSVAGMDVEGSGKKQIRDGEIKSFQLRSSSPSLVL